MQNIKKVTRFGVMQQDSAVNPTSPLLAEILVFVTIGLRFSALILILGQTTRFYWGVREWLRKGPN